MIATALLLAALLFQTDPLDAATAAFARGDYPAAESLALEASHGAQPGHALYLAALARFRTGDAARALGLLDDSWHTNDRPEAGAWHFNRGSCLYELGRFSEAEDEYQQAAGLDPSLAAISLIDAGFAALDGGAPDRAKSLSARASAIATGKSLELLADLNAQLASSQDARAAAEYKLALAAFDASDFSTARVQFLRAAELNPKDGKSRIMAGASSLYLSERREAKRLLEEALALQLDPTDAQIARDYLSALAPGLSARGQPWQASARFSAGYDSNALQTGFLEPTEFPGSSESNSPSAFATADLSLARRFQLGAKLFAEAAYGFDQLAYFSSDAADRSLQQHTLLASLEYFPRDDLRLGISLGGQLDFTGLGNFRGLEAEALSALWGVLDEGDRFSTRVDLGYQRKGGLSEFDYLTGDRIDAAVSEELRAPPATFDLGYRFRAELIGVAEESVTTPPPMQLCPNGCMQTLSDPFGYTSNTLWGSASTNLFVHWTLEASGGVELRDYTADNFLEVSFPNGNTMDVDRRRRQDVRWFGGAAISWWLTSSVAFTLRYDLVINRSNIDDAAADGPGGQCGPPNFSCHVLDAEVRSYDKQVVSIGTALTW